MKLVPASEFDLDLWVAAYAATYNPDLQYEMGLDPETQVDFLTFYDDTMGKIRKGTLHGWAVFNGEGEFAAYQMLSLHPSFKEWEVISSVTDRKYVNSGIGIRSHIATVRFAFEELGAQWVWAISVNRVPSVVSLLERFGYVPFGHVHLLYKDWFARKWGGK